MRLTQIDTAKFLSIFFVILSHSCMNGHIAPILFAFHVQLFFICYGYVFKDKNYALKDYILNSYKTGGGNTLISRILIPFLLLCLILGGPLTIPFLLRILYGRISGVPGIAHLWFLPCFFVSAYIFNILTLLFRHKRKVMLIVVSILGIVSSMLDYDTFISVHINNKTIYLTGYGDHNESELYWGFPYTFNAALTGVVFMYIGSLLRRIFEKYNVLAQSKIFIPLGLLSGVVGLITFYVNQQFITNNFVFHLITMAHAIYGNYVLFLLTSVLLTIATICLSCLIDNSITAKYGKCTMEIYAFHPFITGIMGSLITFCHLPDFQGILVSVTTLTITCTIIPIIRYIDPAIIGVRK